MTTLAPAAPSPVTPAPTGSERHGPWVVRHAGTLAWRGIIKTIHSPEALLDVTLQPVVFLLLFVYVFGGAISGSTGSYLQLALPGVLVQTIVFASAGTGVGLAEDLQTGIFDRFRSLPIARSAPLVGAILADLVRYLTSGLIMIAIGFVLGFRVTTNPLALVAALGLVMVFAFAFCWVFTALAMVVQKPRSVQGLSAIVMLPITFASNAFVPASTMPGWLRGFVDINPVTHVVNAARGLLTGGPVAEPVTFALISSGVVFAIFAPLAVHLYRRRT